MRKIFETTVFVMALVLLVTPLVSCMTTGTHDVELQIVDEAEELAENEVPVESEGIISKGESVPAEETGPEIESAPADDAAEEDVAVETIAEETPAGLPERTEAVMMEEPKAGAETPNEAAIEADPDSAIIGDIVIPRWFMYISSGLFLATLITICYIYNQRRKSIWYGRHE